MTEIYDSNGTRITVGARVLDPDPTALSAGGVVTEITEPDGDVNVYGRPVAVGPFVTVTYDDGTIERYLATWNATGPWDDHRTDYTCDDLTVAVKRGESVDLAAVEALERFAAGYVENGHFRVYMSLNGYGVRDERTGEFVADALTYDEAVETARSYDRNDGREPDGQRIEAGRIVPTDR